MQTTAVLNFRDRQLEYYDSLGGVDERTISALLRWVRDDIRDKYGEEASGAFDVRACARVCGVEMSVCLSRVVC